MSEIVAFAVGLLVAAGATALLSRRRERARRREMAAARAWLESPPVPEGTPLGEDDITEPEPAVVRGRSQAQVPLDERLGHHGDGPEDGDQEPAGTAGRVPEQPGGDVLVELEDDGKDEAQGEQADSRDHQPYASRGHSVVIPGALRRRSDG